MYNDQRPDLSELPSSGQLLRSTLIALIAAGVLLVTVVMPAEYAIDPTGAGRLLGLTQMGELKQTLAEEAATEAQPPAEAAPAEPGATTPDKEEPVAAQAEPAPAAAPTPAQPAPPKVATQQHEVNLTLKPNQATEIKLEMKEGAKANFHWTANGGRLNYDTHGDPYKAPKGFYHGYGKGKNAPELQGELVAAFDGKHGWFWRNRTNETVKLTLRTDGEYITIEQVF
ncbi:MAG: transmembrane anchor protein [Pseudomonas sp.]|uniref:transmembrane anchor protein n=1 Tax=Stutzerimonas kunmingensis TaxID=1211807 RepID=UPI0008B971F8|nr:transmembrane anchor protein [Stutzerimonas kunmingensis]OHC16109.1 MAG: transmembrane anchor protein [Pseudomonadales bacterium GWC2_63_15]TVT73743.1 MAG: transmembrane anchor protein [Pseudomonas sp.]